MNQRLCAILPLLALLFVASLNRVTAVSLQGTNGTLGSFAYGYDTVHRRTYMQVDAALGDVFAYDDTDQVTGVQYDATNPDTTPSSPVRTVNYGFDPVGNRTNVTDNGSGTSYTANNLNQYTAVGGASPTYDPNGNLTNYNGWGYAYDAQNRLWGAANSNTTGLFTYDARNRVVSRVVNSTTNYYFYDDWNLVSDRDAAGNALQTYVHGPRIDELLFKTDGSNVVYYHHDALGNVTHLTDSYSRVVERYRYDIYGQASIKDGNGNPLTGTAYGNRFQFTGREYLANFGLHDYRNRVYLQSWGRFIQTDPIRFDAKDVNIYRYCGNRPHLATDPSGLENLGSFVGAMGLIGGMSGGFTTSILNQFSKSPSSLDDFQPDYYDAVADAGTTGLILALGGLIYGSTLTSYTSAVSGITVTPATATLATAAELGPETAAMGALLGEAQVAIKHYGQPAMDAAAEALFELGEVTAGFVQMLSDNFMDYYF